MDVNYCPYSFLSDFKVTTAGSRVVNMVVAVRFIQKGGDMTGRSPFEWRRPPPTRHRERKKTPLLNSLLQREKKEEKEPEKGEMQNLRKQFG